MKKRKEKIIFANCQKKSKKMIHYVRKLFDQIFYTVYIIRRCLTMDKLNHKAVTSLNEVLDSELDIILGGSRWWQGVVQQFHMNVV